MSLSVAQMALMSRLLDEALPLDEGGRRAWLAALPAAHHGLLEALRQALLPEGAAAHGPTLEAPRVPDAQQPQSPGSALAAGDPVGPYRLIRILGAGGMAEVWLAARADGAFEREVALKLPLFLPARGDIAQRFAREREILATLNHPNIALLYDAGMAPGGQPYLALEYVAGIALSTHCDQQRLTVRARLALFQQVLQAVRYAHARLVIHRDLKPSNILVTAEGQVRLLDFGIAKLLNEGEAKETELTRHVGRALTLDYAAPEQLTGDPVTTATDVYALGVILYELLSGQRPYRLKRDSRGALEEAILNTEPAPPSRAGLTDTVAQCRGTAVGRLARALRGDLDAIVTKALKKNPAERYATVDAFSEDIARYLAGAVVLAQRDSLAYRAYKFTRRHWAGVAVAGALVLMLAAGLVVTGYESRVAAAERDVARRAQLRSLTQTAAARLKDADVAGAMGTILEVLSQRVAGGAYSPEAISVFHEIGAADAQLAALTGHTNTVWRAAFSPDGARVLSASWDGTARLWDVATGRELLQLRGHTGRLNSASYSLDGRRIVTTSFDKTVRVWDAATGVELLRFAGHTRQVMGAEFSPDGRRIASVSVDKSLRLWDAQTGVELVQFAAQPGRLTAVAFSPDGARIATAADDNMARIWDARTGKQLVALAGHTNRVWDVAFSPDGRQLVTASQDKSARIWDVADGREVLRLNGHSDRVNSAAFSADGRRIVTSSDDRSVRLWDAASAREIGRFSGHTEGGVWSANFSPDGRTLVSASTDRTVRLWDIGDHELVRAAGHTARLSYAVYSPDGKRFLTASSDRTCRIWDAASGAELVRLVGHTDPVNFATFSRDGARVATASDDQTARIWDAASGRELLVLRGHSDRLSGVGFSPDGARVVTSSLDKTVREWDATTGQTIRVLSGHTDRVEAAAFSTDGARILTAGNDRTARVWDAASGRQLVVLSGHTRMVGSARFSPDGMRVVTASEDETARVWDVATGRELVLLSGHSAPLNFAEFSADGRRVATASDDHTARIWDAATGEELKLIYARDGGVGSAVFSPDGRGLLTALEDASARIWDAAAAPVETQIAWAEAAQFDALPEAERARLGLAVPADVRQWRDGVATECDRAAAAPYDPERRAAGVSEDELVADVAIAACSDGPRGAEETARRLYQRARAVLVKGDAAGARQDLEQATAAGYHTAQVDLARLLMKPAAGAPDVARALSLYEKAWREGVAVAGFELGALYEHGVQTGSPAAALLAPDPARAWGWYQRAADAGEPNSLARFAERVASRAGGDSELLEAFGYYAAAAERARIESWPSSASKTWRYRRASLARLLAGRGMALQVADRYRSVRAHYAGIKKPRSS